MKSRIFLKLFAAALVLIAACMLTMYVLVQKSWEGMLRREIESSMRQKTVMLASRPINIHKSFDRLPPMRTPGLH